MGQTIFPKFSRNLTSTSRYEDFLKLTIFSSSLMSTPPFVFGINISFFFHTEVFTVRNEFAKVMFLHLSVCLQGGLPQCMLGYHPRTRHPPQEQALPRQPGTPPRQAPPSRRLLLRTVRILLECILVLWFFKSSIQKTI